MMFKLNFMQTNSPYAWLSTYLFGFFFTYGIYIPFWALWFEEQGISASDIGILIGLGLASRCISNLLITPRFSNVEQLLPALRVLTLISTITVGSFYFSGSSFWLMVTSTLLFNLASGPIPALGDALSNYYSKLRMLDYGKTRLWGSLGFVAGSLVVGYLVAQWGTDMILYTAIASFVVTYLLVLRAPAHIPISDAEQSTTRVGIFSLLKQRKVQKFLLLVSLIQASHAAYYGFGSIHWKGIGYSEDIIGYLWSLGVISEVLVFAFSQRLFSRTSLNTMFIIAGIGVVVRWGLAGSTTALVGLVVIQTLHGVTFAIAHIATIRYIQQQPQRHIVPLQALYNAIPMGALMAFVTVMSGWGYEYFGGYVFWLMASMGALSLLVKVDKK